MRYPPLVNLPQSVDAIEWREIEQEIAGAESELGASMFRFWCFNSYWFFLKYCTTFGELICRDRHNKHFGRPWIDHPWLFDRANELQEDPNDKWFQWPRYYFKTTLISVYYPMWEWIRDVGVEPSLKKPGTDITVLVLTWKTDQTGESILFHAKREIAENLRLKHHWPDLFYENPRDSGEFTSTSLRIRQKGNPKEPSFAISGIDNMPTMWHFSRIIVDDACIRETVRSRDRIASTYAAMRQSTFLGNDDTEKRWVGTHWAPGDCYALAIRDELFKVDHQDCYDEEGNAVLRSHQWLEQWRKSSDDYDWAAQMRGDPVASSEQRFKDSWLQHFSDANKERRRKNVYIFIDAARSDKDYADYTAIAVIALGADRNYYVLDMYRDRLNLEDFTSLLFDLVLLWDPITVWEEQVGAQRDIEHITYAQRQEGFRFSIQEVPNEKVPKVESIGRLQRVMCQGRYFFPLAGFGHNPKGDPRDVYQVFKEEEYSQWTPEAGSLHDDLLDVLSMPLRLKMAKLLRWPRGSEIRQRAEAAMKKRGYRSRKPQQETTAWVM